MQKFQDQLQPDIQTNISNENLEQNLYSNARNNFVKKVYAILSLQLLITTAFVMTNMLSESFAKFQSESTAMFVIALIVSVVSLLTLACCGSISKTYPQNVICLFVFTLAESYMVSLICSLYTPASVLNAAVATLAATTGLSLYAHYSKSDFTECMHFMLAFFWSFFLLTVSLTIINVFFIHSQFVTILIAVAIGTIYSIYLIIDTQLILGGRKSELTLDNYVLGAAMLYIDIIQLFLQILKILGERRD